MTRFLREPVSVRGAVGVIVTATAVVVGSGGVAMRLLDQQEYPNVNRLLRESGYLGPDAEFEAAIRALVVGLLANSAAGRLVPPDAHPQAIDPALIPSLHNEENTRVHGTEES